MALDVIKGSYSLTLMLLPHFSHCTEPLRVYNRNGEKAGCSASQLRIYSLGYS